MYKKFIINFFVIYSLSNSICSNAIDQHLINYYCNGNQISLGVEKHNHDCYNFNDSISYLLLDKKHSNNINDKDHSTINQQNNNTYINWIKSKEKQLWEKSTNKANIQNMEMIADSCISLIDIYDMISNAENTTEQSREKLLEILFQLDENNYKIFIPALALAINNLNKTKQLHPLGYIYSIFFNYKDIDEVTFKFHVVQLIDYTCLPIPEIYGVISDDRTPIKKIFDQNIGTYNINLKTKIATLEFITIDAKTIRVEEHL